MVQFTILTLQTLRCCRILQIANFSELPNREAPIFFALGSMVGCVARLLPCLLCRREFRVFKEFRVFREFREFRVFKGSAYTRWVAQASLTSLSPQGVKAMLCHTPSLNSLNSLNSLSLCCCSANSITGCDNHKKKVNCVKLLCGDCAVHRHTQSLTKYLLSHKPLGLVVGEHNLGGLTQNSVAIPLSQRHYISIFNTVQR